MGLKKKELLERSVCNKDVKANGDEPAIFDALWDKPLYLKFLANAN